MILNTIYMIIYFSNYYIQVILKLKSFRAIQGLFHDPSSKTPKCMIPKFLI